MLGLEWRIDCLGTGLPIGHEAPWRKRKTEKQGATNRRAASKFYLFFSRPFLSHLGKVREKKKTKCRSLAAPVCQFLKNRFFHSEGIIFLLLSPRYPIFASFLSRLHNKV